MKYTGRILKGILNKLVEEYNKEYDGEIPYIDFNVRIVNSKSYRGQYAYKFTYGGMVKPISLHFSSYMLKNDSEANIMNTIKHELAHYIVSIETNANHGHDIYWIETCKKLNMEDISETYNMTIEEYRKSFKYIIVDCMDNVVGYRNRLTRELKTQILLGEIVDKEYRKPCRLLNNDTNNVVVEPIEALL